MELNFDCKNKDLTALGSHSGRKADIYIRAHLVKAFNIDDLILELNDTIMHELLHCIDGRLSHEKIYSILRAMMGDEDFRPRINVIDK